MIGKNILQGLTLHVGSLENYSDLYKIVNKVKADEIYHLAAQAYDGYSFENAFYTFKINIEITHGILSSIKNFSNRTKFFFASSSEVFGDTKNISLDESSIFNPRSAYGISKVTGYYLTKNYRDAYKLHASNGILFNHESPRRGFEFELEKYRMQLQELKKDQKKN